MAKKETQETERKLRQVIANCARGCGIDEDSIPQFVEEAMKMVEKWNRKQDALGRLFGWRSVYFKIDEEGSVVEDTLRVIKNVFNQQEGVKPTETELTVSEAKKIGEALLQHAIQKSLERGEDPLED